MIKKHQNDKKQRNLYLILKLENNTLKNIRFCEIENQQQLKVEKIKKTRFQGK